MPQTSDAMARFKKDFSLFGTRTLDACPVCASKNVGLLWQLPQVRLQEPAYLFYGDPQDRTNMRGGAYIKSLPILSTPQVLYRYDICGDCGSAFRNPTSDDQATYRVDTSKVEAFKRKGIEHFRGRTKYIAQFFPESAKTIVDAASGGGQTLAILQTTMLNTRLVGLEISEPSVKHMQSLGLDAHVADLDNDDLDAYVAPGAADFVIFSESFEHVRHPISVLRKLVRMLRPGGRLYYSAQFYGPETQLQIRVAEPIYLNVDYRNKIPSLVNCKLHEGSLRGDKIQDVLEKL